MRSLKREVEPKQMIEELLSEFDAETTPRAVAFLTVCQSKVSKGEALSLEEATTLEYMYYEQL